MPDQAIAGHFLWPTGHPKVIGTLPVRTTDGQAPTQSQICYQRLQNQFDRHFVGGIGAPLVSGGMSSILRHCSIEPLPADRAATVVKVWRAQPLACKQRVTTKVARTASCQGVSRQR
jgi:hypothetical protein